jgi:hypothetical protein
VLGTAFVKPVYVNTIYEAENDLMRRVYVKSSSFPLIPQLIKNTQLENLLETMVDSQANRAAFATAVKVGNYESKLDIFESADGAQTKAIRKVGEEEARQHILEVPRDGMKIQQEVPYKDKEEINKVTGGVGVDYSIDAAGQISTIESAFAAIRIPSIIR